MKVVIGRFIILLIEKTLMEEGILLASSQLSYKVECAKIPSNICIPIGVCNVSKWYANLGIGSY